MHVDIVLSRVSIKITSQRSNAPGECGHVIKVGDEGRGARRETKETAALMK